LNLKPWSVVLALFTLAALPPADLSADQKFDAPGGVTLVAQGGGRYLLLWDPIYRDDLQGYSVWLRKPGDREFVRLSIPVKVGKEVKKEPMTSDSKIVLSMGRDRDDLEMTVVAEYEDGVSPKSRVARSAWAMREAPALAAGPEGADAVSPSAATAEAAPRPASPSARDLYPTEADAAPAGLSRWSLPWNQRTERPLRPLITPPGKISTQLGLAFDLDRFITQGMDTNASLGVSGTGTNPNQVVSWQRTDVRTIFGTPLTLRLGLAPCVEAWAQASYHAEDYFLSSYDIDGTVYQNYVFYRSGPGGQRTFISNPTSSGLADTLVGLRLQPVPVQPLVLGVQLSLPTGVSRFKSMIDAYNGPGTPAGTGEGVARMKADLDWGYKGLRSGLSFHGAVEPGASETYVAPFFGQPAGNQTAELGSQWELGGAFTFPFTLMEHSGALAIGVAERSIQADSWTYNGTEVHSMFSEADLGQFAALGGLQFQRDDQLAITVDFFQDLAGGFETKGTLGYTLQSMGDAFSVAGQFSY
jgi:hypothetical protein